MIPQYKNSTRLGLSVVAFVSVLIPTFALTSPLLLSQSSSNTFEILLAYAALVVTALEVGIVVWIKSRK